MGGYGALYLGAKYPHIFSGVSGHSSVTSLASILKHLDKNEIVFSQEQIDQGDVFCQMQKNRNILPPIRFDCGEGDFLLLENKALHNQLIDAKISHIYQEFKGGHEWPYWREHIRDTLIFFASIEKNYQRNSF